MKQLIKKILKEEISQGKVICDGCGWTWKLSEGGDDKYICHKCGHDNTPKESNLQMVINKLTTNFPTNEKIKLEKIRKFIEDYITRNGYNVKFSKSCNTGFRGVRTNNEIIICNPNSMEKLGDFLYTIFHEIRHEQQISKIKMLNPLSDMDLDDFETLYNQYWEMELDADQFAKNMIAKFVLGFDLPIDVAKEHLGLSLYVKSYPNQSEYIRNSLKNIIQVIKDLKKQGIEVKDARDIPIVKSHLEDLEDLI